MPKSSSAKWKPSPVSASVKSRTRSKSRRAAVSVISNVTRSGRMPLARAIREMSATSVVVVEVQAREVDADLELGADALAGRREAVEGGRDDGAVDRRHDAEALGGSEKLGGKRDASVGLAHAGESLDGHDATASDLGHGLKVGDEARLGERRADAVRLLAQPTGSVSLAVRRVVKAHAAAAAALGLMHGEVGREEQVRGAARMFGEHGHARARCECERVALPRGRHPANERDDGLCARRGFGRGGPGKQDPDLVAAYAAGGLSPPGACREESRPWSGGIRLPREARGCRSES